MADYFEIPDLENDMRRDAITLDLFEVPQPLPVVEGTYDFRALVARMVAELLDKAAAAGLNRYQVAAEVSRLTGKEVSKAMLDNYTSVAHDTFNIPHWLVPAIESVCRAHLLTQWLVKTRGGKLLVGREALNAELGRLERERDEAARKIRQLKGVMGDQA